MSDPQDPQRPIYHFLPPANWMNDPNGAAQWKGVYHLFYQYNPLGAYHYKIHWGHAISTDLVHWKHLPVALSPTPDSPDAGGCWSGCTINDNGTPKIFYTGWSGDRESSCLAISTDDLLTLQKYPGNPIISGPPPSLETEGFRDHCIWKEDETWYQIIGSGIKGAGGTALLYSSTDLLNWTYLHPLLSVDTAKFPQLANAFMFECPDFFPLASTESDGVRYVLNMSVMDDVPSHYPAYFTGVYSESEHVFNPEQLHRLDYGPSFYAPQTFLDETGRRIMWGWLRESRSDDAQREAGWSGLMAIPRVLSMRPDGIMLQQPAPEIEMLRGRHLRHTPDEGTSITPEDGTGWRNDAVEIIVEFDLMDAAETGIAVRCSADEREQTRIFYDRVAQQLVMDTTQSSLDTSATLGIYNGPLVLDEGEKLRLRIFVDHSSVEVFGNDRICITGRIYPTMPDTAGINIIVNGGKTRLVSLDVWEMQSIWPDGLSGATDKLP